MALMESDESYQLVMGREPAEDAAVTTEFLDGHFREVYNAVSGPTDVWYRRYKNREVVEDAVTLNAPGLLDWQHAMQKRIFDIGGYYFRRSCWKCPVEEVPQSMVWRGAGAGIDSSALPALTDGTAAGATDGSSSAGIASGSSESAAKRARKGEKDKPKHGTAPIMSALAKAEARSVVVKERRLKSAPASVSQQPALAFKKPTKEFKCSYVVIDPEPIFIDAAPQIVIDLINELEEGQVVKVKSATRKPKTKEDGWRADIEALLAKHIERPDELLMFGDLEQLLEKTKGTLRPKYHRDKFSDAGERAGKELGIQCCRARSCRALMVGMRGQKLSRSARKLNLEQEPSKGGSATSLKQRWKPL